MKFSLKFNIKQIFEKNFSFDSNIDLNNDVEVLYRRNKVIKNIIFISNILYSIILFAITIGKDGLNWLWSVIPLPLTIVLNMTIKKIIEAKEQGIIRQQIGMYFCSIYMIVTSFLVYFKLRTTPSTLAYAEAGYLLLYFAMIVVSFYQDTKMLKNIFWWMLAVMTVIHFTLTYNFFSFESQGIVDFFKNVIPAHPEIGVWFRDIIFRTVVLLFFMLALYINTRVTERVLAERKQELSKRRSVQEEYTDVVSSLFNLVLDSKMGFDDDMSQLPLIDQMSRYLAKLCGLNQEEIESLSEYVFYNQKHQLKLELEDGLTEEEKYVRLEEQSAIGKQIAKRMQLSQKAESIVRATLEGWATGEFKEKMLKIQNDVSSQIILLVMIYITLRSAKSYKRPYPHQAVLDYISREFTIYFDKEVYERFLSFHSHFQEMYNDYEL